MALQTSGTISIYDIKNEFGGDGTHGLFEYYRGKTYVKDIPQNSNVPTSKPIAIFDFYGAQKAAVVSYELIGGGGGGGGGQDNGFRNPRSYAIAFSRRLGGSDGGTSTLTRAFDATSNGGTVGATAHGGSTYEYLARGTHYGRAGAATGRTQRNGNHTPSTSYGCGGNGATGDTPSRWDKSGGAGLAGSHAPRKTGTKYVQYGSTISYSIGGRGAGAPSTWRGGNGAGGYAKIRWDGKSKSATSGSGSWTID